MNLEEQKDYGNALARVAAGRAGRAEDARIHNDVAALLYMQGDNEGAITGSARGGEGQPMDDQAHFTLGLCLLQAGHAGEAREDWSSGRWI